MSNEKQKIKIHFILEKEETKDQIPYQYQEDHEFQYQFEI